MSTAGGPFVGVIEVPRAADVLADRLRQRVLSGELVEGDVLPPERALMTDTGLGRATVREALRVLEAEALITPRVGRYGGWTVRRPGRDSVTRSIDVFIRGTQIRFGSLLAAREAIEPSCAALAADHRTDADLEALEQRSAHLASCYEDLPEYLLENVRWHLAIVDATHNELLIAIMSALGEAILAGTNIDNFNSLEVRRAALHAHDGVVAAIRERDAAAAFRRMFRHVHAFRSQASGTPG
ncbi:MAG: GntR family transcriptional regulator [Ilumatobacteraceae bacterium]|nr:GntR family transcriptional regulator [Ilumatobacteraceae bacterium]